MRLNSLWMAWTSDTRRATLHGTLQLSVSVMACSRLSVWQHPPCVLIA